MSRLDDLRRTRPVPSPAQYLTSEEVATLVAAWQPTFAWHEEENFYPQSSTSLMTPRAPSLDRGDPGPNGEASIRQIPHFRHTFRSGAGENEFFHDDPAMDGTKASDELSLTNDSWVASVHYQADHDIATGTTSPAFPVRIYAEFRDPLAALLADWQGRVDGRLPDATVGPIDIPGPLRKGLTYLPTNPDPTNDQVDKLTELYTAVSEGVMYSEDLLGELLIDDEVLEAALNYCFLEFYLLYAWNDLSVHQPWWNLSGPITRAAGDHPGDVEASAVLAFNRDQLAQIAAVDPDDPARAELLRALEPTHLIVMGHNYGNANDWALPIDVDRYRQPGDESRIVYVAAGSHAAAPTSAASGYVGRLLKSNPEITTLAALAGGPLFVALVLLAEVCFDSTDKRSKDGVHTGVGDVDITHGDDDPDATRGRTVIVPLGDDNDSIYADPIHDRLLAERSFPGTWGVDTSVRWRPKTGRALRVLADNT